MATSDNVKSYENAAEIVDYWIKHVAPRYFDMANVNTYRAGTLGFINDVMSTTTEDTAHGMMIARREFYPNTAQYLKSLYKHAAARSMNAPMATPAQATILLMIQQSDILKYGTDDGDLHTFVLDDTFIAYVDDIPFMLDFPINILSVQRENGKYAHTTHYDFYIDNSLVTSTERYLPNKVINYKGTDYIVISAKIRQINKTYESQLVTSNTIVNTVTMDFSFDGSLANFEVFYKENDTTARVQLEKHMADSTIPKVPFCWYTLVDDSTIRLTFPANAYFVPRLNSTISIEIATTLGSGGNFDSYESDIVSENASTRFPYNGQVPVFGAVDGASTGGKDVLSKEDFREEVMRAYCTNNVFITNNDLQLYFDKLMIGTNDRFKFVKKRDDAFVRLYGAFLLMKDTGNNVVPTNTLDVYLDPLQAANDFDIYSEAVKRYIIRPGALFTYKAPADESDKYEVVRIRTREISDDLSDYDNEQGVMVCTKCGYHYTGELPIPEDYICPVCEAKATDFVNNKFIFTNPYLISVSIDNFMAGYFLNSVEAYHALAYTAVNDLSIVQFIARHFKVERNAIAGENFYRFSVALSPSIDDINMETIFQQRDDIIIAKHNGYVKAITFDEDAVYAHIVYTDDPTSTDPIPEEETEETIQISSYISKVDQYFYICPECGYRMTEDEWNTLKEKNFLDEEGNPIHCDHCPTDDPEKIPPLVADFVRTYIDYDYFPGFNMNFSVGNHITKNDVIANAKPKDLGRIRIMMDLGDVMSSSARRYIPMTLEEAHVDSTTTTNYFIFSAYISTDDMVDSKHIMSIENGYVMTDGSSGKNHSLSIPIDNLPMKLHAFYEYREEDELNEATRNPRHDYSSFNYVSGFTFTNTYELFDGDYITLMKSLDNARGFLDALERPTEPEPPDPNPDPEPDPDHPDHEINDRPQDKTKIFLRDYEHLKFRVDVDDDRYNGNWLTVDPEPGTELPDDGGDGDGESGGDDGGGSIINPPPVYPPEEGEYGDNFIYHLRNCPFVAANWIKLDENEAYFIDRITSHYAEIEKVSINLENAFSIDMKFYNTYGKSKFYKIGNSSSLSILDSVNITMNFGAAVVFPTTIDVFRDNFRSFVTSKVEATDDMVGNGIDLYVMNIIAGAKTNFDEIAYLEYYGINQYDYSAQRITIMSDDEILQTVSADSFVPEFLNIIRETVNGESRPKIKLTILNSELQ